MLNHSNAFFQLSDSVKCFLIFLTFKLDESVFMTYSTYKKIKLLERFTFLKKLRDRTLKAHEGNS